MPRIEFETLPNHGRLWVFPASRTLTSPERATLVEEVDSYLDEWAAHGVPLSSGREVRYGQFLLVAVDEDVEAPSGCSIDALVNRLRALGTSLDVTLIDHASVWYREGGEVRRASRAEFRALAEEGVVGADTLVFDTTLTRLSDLRAGKFEVPARASWHGRVFFRGALAE